MVDNRNGYCPYLIDTEHLASHKEMSNIHSSLYYPAASRAATLSTFETMFCGTR